MCVFHGFWKCDTEEVLNTVRHVPTPILLGIDSIGIDGIVVLVGIDIDLYSLNTKQYQYQAIPIPTNTNTVNTDTQDRYWLA